MQNFIFETLYFGLTMVMVLMLGATLAVGARPPHEPVDASVRDRLAGLNFIIIGTILSLVSGVSLDTLSKASVIGDLAYQQIHFSIFYIAFAMVLHGFIANSEGIQPMSLWKRKLVWALYGLATLIACVFLFNPASYTVTTSGGLTHYAQQRIFFLPLFYTLVAWPVLILTAPHVERRRVQKNALWISFVVLFLFIGLLREATIIPASGTPIIDILVAFGSFTLASICLCLGARSLLAGRAIPG